MMKSDTASSNRQHPGKHTSRVPGGDTDTLYSEDLFSHGRTVTIVHNGECYTLRLTAANKLLLTK